MLIFSTALMTVLCDVAGWHLAFSWLVTTGLTAMGNYGSMSRWTICRQPEEGQNGSQ